MKSKVFPSVLILLSLSLAAPAYDADARQTEKYTRTIEDYVVPDVTLVNQNGAKIRLRELLHSRKAVMVDFIYTTCTTICPVLSAGFSNFQRRIGTESKNVQLVSISIDPENDTPQKLKEYLRRYDAKPGWEFLTGAREDIEKVVRAFNAYTPNKMSHLPLALLHAPSRGRWVRIYGLIGTSDLIAEYEKAVKK